MQRGGVILVLLALSATTADARWRHHHHRHSHGRFDERQAGLPTPERAQPEGARPHDVGMAGLVPRGWQLQPASPAWQGRRYVSPDHSAWIAFYETNASNDAAARFKAVAFGDGEEITSLNGMRDRLTVSGRKGDAIFYRKVMLACGGTTWRHVAMEYPASAQRDFDGFIARISRAFERVADDACGESVFTHPEPVANAPKTEEKATEQKPVDAKPEEKPGPPR